MNALLIALTAAAGLISENFEKKNSADPIDVLVVTGTDIPPHRWKETAPAIRRVLEKDSRFRVRIVEDPEFLASDRVFDYDVVFLHFYNDKPLKRASQIRENLVNFVKKGKGLVAFHFASGAMADWPEYRNLIGKVWDGKNTHDRRGVLAVKATALEHPITRKMKGFQADDELYYCLSGERPVKVLATARSKDTGTDQPMAFVFEYGAGRVFHTPLGHDPKAIEMPGVAELIRRGCAWVAGREL